MTLPTDVLASADVAVASPITIRTSTHSVKAVTFLQPSNSLILAAFGNIIRIFDISSTSSSHALPQNHVQKTPAIHSEVLNYRFSSHLHVHGLQYVYPLLAVFGMNQLTIVQIEILNDIFTFSTPPLLLSHLSTDTQLVPDILNFTKVLSLLLHDVILAVQLFTVPSFGARKGCLIAYALSFVDIMDISTQTILQRCTIDKPSLLYSVALFHAASDPLSSILRGDKEGLVSTLPLACGTVQNTIRLFNVSLNHLKKLPAVADGSVADTGDALDKSNTHACNLPILSHKTLHPLAELRGHRGVIFRVKFLSPYILVSASDDRELRVWVATSAGTVSTVATNSVVDASTFVCFNVFRGHTARIWDIGAYYAHSGENVIETKDLGRVCLCGWYIVSAGEDATCRIWNAQTSECVYSFVGHTGRGVRSLYVSTNLQLFVSGGEDGGVKLWNIRDSFFSSYTKTFPKESNKHRCDSSKFVKTPKLEWKLKQKGAKQSDWVRNVLLLGDFSYLVVTNYGCFYHLSITLPSQQSQEALPFEVQSKLIFERDSIFTCATSVCTGIVCGCANGSALFVKLLVVCSASNNFSLEADFNTYWKCFASCRISSIYSVNIPLLPETLAAQYSTPGEISGFHLLPMDALGTAEQISMVIVANHTGCIQLWKLHPTEFNSYTPLCVSILQLPMKKREGRITCFLPLLYISNDKMCFCFIFGDENGDIHVTRTHIHTMRLNSLHPLKISIPELYAPAYGNASFNWEVTQFLPKIHGKAKVLDLVVANGYVYSSGADGSINMYKLETADSTHVHGDAEGTLNSIVALPVSLKKVSSFRLPNLNSLHKLIKVKDYFNGMREGSTHSCETANLPELEELSRRPALPAFPFHLCAFHASDFVLWDLHTSTELHRIACGGNKRPFCIGYDVNGVHTFIYVADHSVVFHLINSNKYNNILQQHKSGTNHIASQSYESHELDAKSLDALRLSLNSGFHGREIACCCWIDKNVVCVAGEENSLKLLQRFPVTQFNKKSLLDLPDRLSCTQTDVHNISSIRDMCTLKYIHNHIAISSSQSLPTFLVTVGSRMCLNLYAILDLHVSRPFLCHKQTLYVAKRKMEPEAGRLMSVDGCVVAISTTQHLALHFYIVAVSSAGSAYWISGSFKTLSSTISANMDSLASTPFESLLEWKECASLPNCLLCVKLLLFKQPPSAKSVALDEGKNFVLFVGTTTGRIYIYGCTPQGATRTLGSLQPHQNGVNCILTHMLDVPSQTSRYVLVVSCGDDQSIALSLMEFNYRLVMEQHSIGKSNADSFYNSIRIIASRKIENAHSSSIRCGDIQYPYIFSTGWDQCIRIWKLCGISAFMLSCAKRHGNFKAEGMHCNEAISLDAYKADFNSSILQFENVQTSKMSVQDVQHLCTYEERNHDSVLFLIVVVGGSGGIEVLEYKCAEMMPKKC